MFQGTPVVVVANTYLPKLKWLQDAYGGTVVKNNSRTLSRRQQYQWRIYGSGARAFLEDIREFLDEKREQANIALKLSTLPPADRKPLLVRLSALKRINYDDNTPR